MGSAGIDVFDELVVLAARLAGTPIAAINLIGEDRQWTVAGVGLAAGDASRETSLCDFAITERDATVIEDLREDPRFAGHPSVNDGLRFYAGFPLLSDEGLALGAFCVADVHPRALSDDQLSSLHVVARAAAAQLAARRQAAAARESGDRLQAVIDNAADAFVSMDGDGRITEWNLEAQRMLGFSREEACGRTVSELIIPPALREAHQRGLARYMSTRESRIHRGLVAEAIESAGRSGASESEYRLVRPDGDVRWIHGRRRCFTTDDGVARVAGTLQDITDRREAEYALRDAEERFRRSFDDAPIGMALVSLEGRWMKVNDALCRLTGYPADRLLKLSFQDITHPHDLRADTEYVRQMIEGERATYQMDKRYLHAEGQIIWVQLNVSIARGESGAPMYFISQIQDITERKELERRLQDAARRDHLTGLLNRRGFEEELGRQLTHADRYRRGGAVLVIDLDGFKAVNDTLGHRAGDELLAGIARVMGERLRKTDVLGRLGGDEFAVVLPEVSREQALQVLASLTDVIDCMPSCSWATASAPQRASGSRCTRARNPRTTCSPRRTARCMKPKPRTRARSGQ